MAQFKTYTLDSKHHRELELLARGENGSFWQSLLSAYAEHGSLTAKQMQALKTELALPKLRAYDRDERVPVMNRILRDGKPVCRHCRELAVVAVGRVGVCKNDVQRELQASEAYREGLV